MESKYGLNWLCRPDSVFLAILGQSWTNFVPNVSKNGQIWICQLSFCNFQVKTCIQRIKLSEIVDLSLFYIHLTILDLFWTNFGSVLDYLWAKLGLQYPIRELSHQKIMLNSLLEWENGANWLCRPDSVFLAIFGQFWTILGPM